MRVVNTYVFVRKGYINSYTCAPLISIDCQNQIRHFEPEKIPLKITIRDIRSVKTKFHFLFWNMTQRHTSKFGSCIADQRYHISETENSENVYLDASMTPLRSSYKENPKLDTPAITRWRTSQSPSSTLSRSISLLLIFLVRWKKFPRIYLSILLPRSPPFIIGSVTTLAHSRASTHFSSSLFSVCAFLGERTGRESLWLEIANETQGWD